MACRSFLSFLLGLAACGLVAGPAATGLIEWRLAKSGDGKKKKGKKGGKRKSRDDATEESGARAPEPCAACRGLDGFVPSDEISEQVRTMAGKHTRDKALAVAVQKARGVIETGLYPAFVGGAPCPEIDSEKWAIDYSGKRPWPALHKGIDIPQPRGTPILAVAAGTVVGKFLNEDNRKGIEIMLRHRPDETGLPFWTYSQYTHLLEMSPLPIGAEVAMGDTVGRTSNTGKMGRRVRRDALRFAVFYADNPHWSNDGNLVTPKDGYFMDPNAFYRLSGPYDSPAMLGLPPAEKEVPTPFMRKDGPVVPAGSKRIWLYACD